MPTEKKPSGKANVKAFPVTTSETTLSFVDDGEFATLPRQFCDNWGSIVRYACYHGGYAGISVTDDAGSLRLAVRCGKLTVDARFYSLQKATDASAKVFGVLREAYGTLSD